MSIEISGETAVRLTDEARRLGLSVDALLKRLINDIEPPARLAGSEAELPVWDLGSFGEYHRRDIYDDVC